jgi:hypothetical protein
MKRKARECGIEQGDRNKKAAKKVACWVQLIRLSERTKQKTAVGSGLLSHAVTRVVPSALVRLTAGFGMEPGGPARL